MAGNYPDAPDSRMAYHTDGTVGLYHSAGSTSPIQFSSALMAVANNEATDNFLTWHQYYNGTYVIGLIFPELRDIAGIRLQTSVSFLDNSGPLNGELMTSPNSTNLIDGTWANHGTGAGLEVRSGTTATLRTVPTISLENVKALRWRISYSQLSGDVRLRNLHIYGQRSESSGLRLWHPTMDQPVSGAHFDWGDVPRNTSGDRLFRVKNLEGVRTAHDVVVSVAASTNTTPSVPAQHLLQKASSPGFGSTVSIPSLGPGEVSELLTLRRITPHNAVLSLWWARVTAHANSWSVPSG